MNEEEQSLKCGNKRNSQNKEGYTFCFVNCFGLVLEDSKKVALLVVMDLFEVWVL